MFSHVPRAFVTVLMTPSPRGTNDYILWQGSHACLIASFLVADRDRLRFLDAKEKKSTLLSIIFCIKRELSIHEFNSEYRRAPARFPTRFKPCRKSPIGALGSPSTAYSRLSKNHFLLNVKHSRAPGEALPVKGQQVTQESKTSRNIAKNDLDARRS